MFTRDMTKNQRAKEVTAQHVAAGHEVWVSSGVVQCHTCDHLVLDASGHRPGLVEANQHR